MRRIVLAAGTCAALAGAPPAWAVNPEQPENAPPPGAVTTFLDHGGQGPFWFGAEVNSIFQAHPGFAAAYTGSNSFQPSAEAAVSGLLTVYTAWRPSTTTELIVDAEMAVGGGVSRALGIAGFSNLDVVRNPDLSYEPYLARFEVHQLIPLSREWEDNADRGPVSSFARVPRHRLELRAGHFSTVDIFDINPAGSDSHLQFMNWSVDNNGAYDYAADTRGYTYGAIVEYQGPDVEVRFGEILMPTVANGIQIDFDLTRSHSEQLEVELKYSRRRNASGTLRVLAYENFANMGSYAEAIDAFQRGVDAQPDVTLHRHLANTKYGFGLNLVQEVGRFVRGFARIGWNDGQHESFAYTEVDNTFELGFDVSGALWSRGHDRVGVAAVSNGITPVHADYLRLGGHGFLLGDACDFAQAACARRPAGYLRYAREDIGEAYYNVNIWRGASVAGDVQLIGNPGYNADRGPVWIFSLRGHLEF